MPRKASTVAIYPDRASYLLLAVVGELIAVATVAVASQPRPEVVTNPWLYEEPAKTIFVVLMVALFGIIAPLLLVLRAVLGWPVLTLDAEGIRYYRWVLSRRLVRWDEIQWVRTFTHKEGFSTILAIEITLTPRAQRARGGKGEIRIGLARNLITLPIEEVAERVKQRAHAMRPHAVEWAIRVPYPTPRTR